MIDGSVSHLNSKVFGIFIKILGQETILKTVKNILLACWQCTRTHIKNINLTILCPKMLTKNGNLQTDLPS